MTIKKIALQLCVSMALVEQAIDELARRLIDEESGLTLVRLGTSVQLATHPDAHEVVNELAKDEIKGELSRSATETLSIIAYRGPIKKEDIEHIRGVNCTMALRNLLIRGLIEQKKDPNELQPHYNVSFDFLRYLGLSAVGQLSQYDQFRSLDLSHETEKS